MKRILLAFTAFCLAGSAMAQTPTQLYFQSQNPCPQGRTCMQPVDTTHPLPVTTTGSGGSVTQGTTPWVVGQQPGNVTLSTAAPTAGTFASVLAANTSRKQCTIQGISSSGGTIYYFPSSTGTPTTSNSFQAQSGGYFYCAGTNGVVTDQIRATCGTGTCSFIISEQ